MTAHDILKQKILDTEDGHTTGITRDEVLCIQAKLESLHRELVDTANRGLAAKHAVERALAWSLNAD